MSAEARAERRPILAKVQIARKELRLVEDDYRAILTRITGNTSARDCSDTDLSRVLDEFRRLGWKPKTGKPPSANPQIRIIYAIWKDIVPLLDGTAGVAELRSFVARQTKTDLHPDGVSAPEFLNPEQAIQVIEGLKGWRARLRMKGAK